MFQSRKTKSTPVQYLKFFVLFVFMAVWGLVVVSNQTTAVIYSEGQTIPTPVPPPFAKLSIDNVSQTEGDSSTSQMVFTIERSHNLSDIKVTVSTENKTAFHPDDYASKSEVISFETGGDFTKTFAVNIKGDEKVEGNETFNVVLTNPTDAIIESGEGVGTIENDDSAIVTLSVVDVDKNEGDSGLTAVTLKAVLDSEVSRGFDLAYKTIDGTAEAGLDYEQLEDKLEFDGDAGESQEIVVQIKGDTLVEGNETFSVALGSFTNTDKQAFLSTAGSPQEIEIIDDEVATLTLSGEASKEEGDSGTVSYTFPVVLSEAIPGGFSVEYFTSDETATTADNDYVDNDGTLDFDGDAGEEQVITVVVNGDTQAESNEFFSVSLGDITGLSGAGGLKIEGNPQLGTILNDDGGVFFIDVASSGSTVSEFEATAKIPVTFSGDALEVETTLDYEVTAGTATDGADFTAVSGTLTFEPGDSTLFIEVPIVNDDIEESSETFVVTISNPSGFAIGNPATAEITIIDDEGAVNVNLSQAIIDGDESDASIPVQIELDRAVGFDVSVKVKTSNGSATAGQDYTAVDETVTIDAGDTTATVNIPILPDTIYERNEDLMVTISDPQNGELGGTTEALVKIIEDEPIPTVSISDATQSEAVNGLIEMKFELELSSFAAVDIFIDFETVDGTAIAGEDYIANTGRLRIRAGSRKGTIGVFIYSDGKSEEAETFTLRLTNSSEGTLDGTSDTVDVTGTIEDTQSGILFLPSIFR